MKGNALENIASNEIYRILVSGTKVYIKIQTYYNSKYLAEEGSQVYTNIFSTTTESKLRSYQVFIYKKHNVLYINDRFYEYGSVQSRYCIFCNTEIETLDHSSCDCETLFFQ